MNKEIKEINKVKYSTPVLCVLFPKRIEWDIRTEKVNWSGGRYRKRGSFSKEIIEVTDKNSFEKLVRIAEGEK